MRDSGETTGKDSKDASKASSAVNANQHKQSNDQQKGKKAK